MSEPIDEWRVAAEQALSARWGSPVACEIAATLRERGFNRVFRLAVSGGPVESVILKACVGDEKWPYVHGDPDPNSHFQRLCREWAAGEVLAPLGLGATIYAGDAERGFCLEADLGAGETLAARLTGDDATAAEGALMAYARSLADMHRATQGIAPQWRSRLTELGARGLGADGVGGGPFTTPWQFAGPACASLASNLGFAPPAGLDRDLAAMHDAIERPGDYLTFTPCDCCPDNHYLRGDRVVFFDCEHAQMRHALLDAAYFLAPFPTCWCCGALPGGMPERLIAAYREGFPGGADFDDQLTLALAAWWAVRLPSPASSDWLETDMPWGLSTTRQRLLKLIRGLLERPRLATLLPGLADFVAELDQRLRARWPDLEPMQLYPAFA